MSQKRVAYADVLRIISIFGVLMIHATANVMTACNAKSDPWQQANVLSAIVRFSVPLFFMISGIFFLNPDRQLSAKKLWGKNILRLVTAFLFWGTAYELYPLCFVWHETGIFPLMDFMSGIKSLISADGHFHLYFIYLMLGIYIVTPIIRVFTKNASRRQLEYFILLWFLLSGVIPTVNRFFNIPWLSNWVAQMKISLPVGYLGYSVLGYYLSRYELKKGIRGVIILSGAAAMITAAVLTRNLSEFTVMPNVTLYEGLSPFVMLYAAGIFVLVKCIKRLDSLSGKSGRFLTLVSECTFGIYLIHDFANMALKSLNFSFVEYFPAVSLPIYCIVVFAVCFAIVFVLRKIPLVNRYLM